MKRPTIKVSVLQDASAQRYPRRLHNPLSGPRLQQRHRRHGGIFVEAAIVLPVFVTLVLGLLDISLAVWHYNTLSDAARQVTREAVVRGQFAPPRRNAWGPTAYTGMAADAHEIAQTVQPSLIGLDPAQVSVTVIWPDGSNEIDKRVRCTIHTTHRPLLVGLFRKSDFELSATSTMLIAH